MACLRYCVFPPILSIAIHFFTKDMATIEHPCESSTRKGTPCMRRPTTYCANTNAFYCTYHMNHVPVAEVSRTGVSIKPRMIQYSRASNQDPAIYKHRAETNKNTIMIEDLDTNSEDDGDGDSDRDGDDEEEEEEDQQADALMLPPPPQSFIWSLPLFIASPQLSNRTAKWRDEMMKVIQQQHEIERHNQELLTVAFNKVDAVIKMGVRIVSAEQATQAWIQLQSQLSFFSDQTAIIDNSEFGKVFHMLFASSISQYFRSNHSNQH